MSSCLNYKIILKLIVFLFLTKDNNKYSVSQFNFTNFLLKGINSSLQNKNPMPLTLPLWLLGN